MQSISQLSERQRKILFFVVAEFIRHGEPVPSRSVAQSGVVDVSPATIRNVMAELEELALLVQPHTSAGRVPSPQAMRLYVNWLRQNQQQEVRLDDHVTVRFESLPQQDVTALARSAGSLLSQLSSMAGLVLGPNVERARLRDVRLVPLTEERVLAILVTSTGQAIERAVSLDAPVDPVQLNRMQNYLADLGAGLTLHQLRDRIRTELAEMRTQYRDYARRALQVASSVFDEEPRVDLHVEGMFNIVEFMEFADDIQRLRDLLRTLEEKERLIDILDKIYDAPTPVTFIGPEIGWELGDQFSLVVCGYYRGDEQAGLVGVLGPVRMDYARTIPLVDHAARVLSKELEDRS